MRLWHKDLIPVLPKQQLVGQWGECCMIAKEISEKGTPNHILVNKIMDYPIVHLYIYGRSVYAQMLIRGYKADWYKFSENSCFDDMNTYYKWDDLFENWHNDRYLKQCYFNLQEKFDCGGIDLIEWEKIADFIEKYEWS